MSHLSVKISSRQFSFIIFLFLYDYLDILVCFSRLTILFFSLSVLADLNPFIVFLYIITSSLIMLSNSQCWDATNTWDGCYNYKKQWTLLPSSIYIYFFESDRYSDSKLKSLTNAMIVCIHSIIHIHITLFHFNFFCVCATFVHNIIFCPFVCVCVYVCACNVHIHLCILCTQDCTVNHEQTPHHNYNYLCAVCVCVCVCLCLLARFSLLIIRFCFRHYNYAIV